MRCWPGAEGDVLHAVTENHLLGLVVGRRVLDNRAGRMGSLRLDRADQRFQFAGRLRVSFEQVGQPCAPHYLLLGPGPAEFGACETVERGPRLLQTRLRRLGLLAVAPAEQARDAPLDRLPAIGHHHGDQRRAAGRRQRGQCLSQT